MSIRDVERMLQESDLSDETYPIKPMKNKMDKKLNKISKPEQEELLKQIMKDDEETGLYTVFNPYPKGWKAFAIKLGTPKGLRQWINAIWGLDIFIYRVPLLKTIILSNIIVWILLFLQITLKNILWK